MKSFLISGFLNFAGPVTLLAFLFWLNSLWSLVGPFPLLLRERWRSWAVALLGAVMVFVSTRVDFKVLSDETNLLSVANMLALFGKASNTEMWVNYYHTFHALDVSVPSRPVLFPVLVAIVESLVGLKWWSPFVVNFLCLLTLFGLVLRWTGDFLPERLLPKSLTLLSLLMSPVLAIVATSAGYDVCSLVIGFACFLLLFVYERRRDSAALECLLYGLICFASVRYESIIALPLTAAGLFMLEGKSLLRKLSPEAFWISLVLVAPLFVQRFLTWGSFENPVGVPAFSLWHVVKHLPIFLHSFFLDGNGPYPILLHWLGLGGLLLTVRRIRGVGAILLVYCGFLLLLLLSHHFGRADHPTQVRLFLPISFALGLLALQFLRVAEKSIDGRALVLVFGVLLFHHHEYAVHDPLSAQLTMTREMRFIRDFLRDEAREGDLWVYDRPGQLSALGLSAVSWKHFTENQAGLLLNLRNSLYTRMLVIERVSYDAKRAEEFSLIRPGFRLSPLREHQLSPDERLRISRLDW